MDEKTVYFHVGRFGHPFFDEQLRCAPEGFAYRAAEAGSSHPGSQTRLKSAPRRIALASAHMRRARALLEAGAIHALSRAGHVRRATVEVSPGCFLIHSAQQLLRDSTLPYVVDFECVEVFSLYQRVALSRPWARRRLLDALTDERCRFLLPWSQAAGRGLSTALGARDAERLAAKTVTVLPAIHPRSSRPAHRGSGPLRVLFVGTAFEAKGGVEAIRAVQRVRATHDVVLDVVSDVPERWRVQVEPDAGISLHAWPTPTERLNALFREAHLLVFPSHMDTLGFVVMEAMACGVPVLATRHFATPELVEDGVSGLLVAGENPLYGEDGLCSFDNTLPPPRSFRRSLMSPSDAYVDRIAAAIARVVEERDLHACLANGALARVTEGALSVARRREALESVYRRSLS